MKKSEMKKVYNTLGNTLAILNERKYHLLNLSKPTKDEKKELNELYKLIYMLNKKQDEYADLPKNALTI